LMTSLGSWLAWKAMSPIDISVRPVSLAKVK